MGEEVKILRVVVASPSDVKPERDVLKDVIEDINSNTAKDRRLRLEVSRWEDDAYAGFHVDGPQGLIDAILRIPECDIFVGVFWKRFGTPTKDGTTGSEHEFNLALETWQKTQRPHIMVYFNQKAATPKTPEEADQWKQVLQFQQQFPKEGLWWPYKGKAQFEKLVRRHLTNWLRQQYAMPIPESKTHTKKEELLLPTVSLPAALEDGLRRSYLTWLMKQVRAVPLSGVDRKSIDEKDRRDLDLAAVYTALMTQRPEATEERMLRPEHEQRRLSALAVLNTEVRLALLGDPGTGKSTFVNFLTLCMAGELLHEQDANLKVLRTPLPEEEDRFGEKKKPQPQPWKHGALLPLRVILREFVARGLNSTAAQASENGDPLLNFMVIHC